MANRKEMAERIKTQQHWVDGGDVVVRNIVSGIEGLVGYDNVWNYDICTYRIKQTPNTAWLCEGVDRVFQSQDEVDHYFRNRLNTYTCTQYEEVLK